MLADQQYGSAPQFSLLQQHIEELTQEKLELQVGAKLP